VLYEQRNHAPILQAIAQLLKPSGTAFISDPQRTIAQKFFKLAATNHFTIETTTIALPWRDLTVSVDIHALTQTN
jgi:2-polyprenyl-3-methyl-5-hydroxy-6-metoxy-1,4-benzoquinol methylase